jgi:hypothetical protein
MASSPATPSAGAKNILRCDSAALENICRDYFRLKENSVDSLLSIVGRSNHHGFAADTCFPSLWASILASNKRWR